MTTKKQVPTVNKVQDMIEETKNELKDDFVLIGNLTSLIATNKDDLYTNTTAGDELNSFKESTLNSSPTKQTIDDKITAYNDEYSEIYSSDDVLDKQISYIQKFDGDWVNKLEWYFINLNYYPGIIYYRNGLYITKLDNFSELAYGLGLFVIIPYWEDDIFYSEDGELWNAVPWESKKINGDTFSNRTKYIRIFFGNNIFVALCNYGFISYSSTGKTFTEVVLTSDWLYDMCFGTTMLTNIGYFVAISKTTLYYSTDGITWSNKSIGCSNMKRICYGNSRFFIVDFENKKGYVSTDLDTWSEVSLPALKFDYTYRIYYINGAFLIPQSNCIYYSFDCTNWKIANTNFTLKKICFDNKRLILYDKDNLRVYYSNQIIPDTTMAIYNFLVPINTRLSYTSDLNDSPEVMYPGTKWEVIYNEPSEPYSGSITRFINWKRIE